MKDDIGDHMITQFSQLTQPIRVSPQRVLAWSLAAIYKHSRKGEKHLLPVKENLERKKSNGKSKDIECLLVGTVNHLDEMAYQASS